METKPSRTPEVVFPLRVDRNGYRPVYKLGNEGGNCSFGCKFCGVGKSPRVTSAQNIALFDSLHAKYLPEIDGPYHPAIFNRGNVTDPKAFSPATLNHILGVFEQDSRVSFASLNSREVTATGEVLDGFAARRFPFPIHFIFGQESFNASASRVLGKNNQGEMERFIQKLKRYNQQHEPLADGKRYVFGLDVNLVFLPELYLEAGEPRAGREAKIAEGLANDLRELLRRTDPLVPVEVNIHPYYEVESLPYEKADLFQLLRMLPTLQPILEEQNRRPGVCRTHLFVGAVLLIASNSGKCSAAQERRIRALETSIDEFNRTGHLPNAANLATSPAVS